MPRRASFWLTAAGLVLLGVVAVLWAFNSSYYLISPDRAKPLADLVTVQGGRANGDGGAVLYVDVLLRRASWLERLVPALRPDGSELVPVAALRAPGSSDAERVRQARRQMDRSEQVAAAVALRALGKRVVARPNGVLVDAVAPDVPAAGVLQPTDVVVAADGRKVLTPSDLRRAVGDRAPGDTVMLRVRRGRGTRTVTVKTVASPEDRTRPIIGIQIEQSARIRLPVRIDIDLGDVGGPSAGLAFALQVMEALGRDVDRGYRVAATGELELDGTVAPIGGAAQKAIGARRAHVDVLLVPAGDNAREARTEADGLRIIPVENFQQALRRLSTLPQKG